MSKLDKGGGIEITYNHFYKGKETYRFTNRILSIQNKRKRKAEYVISAYLYTYRTTVRYSKQNVSTFLKIHSSVTT